MFTDSVLDLIGNTLLLRLSQERIFVKAEKLITTLGAELVLTPAGAGIREAVDDEKYCPRRLAPRTD